MTFLPYGGRKSSRLTAFFLPRPITLLRDIRGRLLLAGLARQVWYYYGMITTIRPWANEFPLVAITTLLKTLEVANHISS